MQANCQNNYTDHYVSNIINGIFIQVYAMSNWIRKKHAANRIWRTKSECIRRERWAKSERGRDFPKNVQSRTEETKFTTKGLEERTHFTLLRAVISQRARERKHSGNLTRMHIRYCAFWTRKRSTRSVDVEVSKDAAMVWANFKKNRISEKRYRS